MWRPEDPQGAEAKKIWHKAVPYLRGMGLDLGCGPWKVMPHAIAVDNFDEWYDGTWRPDVLGDVEDLSLFADRSMDFVFSSHVLEHLDDTEAVLREWWRVVKADGYLVLYLPHKEFYPNIGEEGANPDHKHDFMPNDIVETMMLATKGWDLVEDENRNEREEYSFFQVYQKRKGTGHKFSHLDRVFDKRKRLALIRYGAFGDHIQITTVLPKLKAEGWHITYVTTPQGRDVLGENPFVDEFWVQDRDQVPNEALNEYWDMLGYEFDKVINLSESVENTLLTAPGRRTHALPKAARNMLCNVNYFDFIHAIAEVEGPIECKFYPSNAERTRASKYRQRFGGRPVITWALAGSSVHKVWPWTQEVVAWLLEQTDAAIVFTGGPDEQILEFAIAQQLVRVYFDIQFEESNEMKLSALLGKIAEIYPDRIVCTAGAWSIRESLTFALLSNVVVGPETGMLNAVAFEKDVAKVIMLSHSSHEKLTRDWVNTIVVAPIGIECFPCNRLHYSREFCPEDETTGASVCAASIVPHRVFDAITTALDDIKEAA